MYRLDREQAIQDEHPHVFDDSREGSLPLWAQRRLDYLRRVTLNEAANHEVTLRDAAELMEWAERVNHALPPHLRRNGIREV